MLECVGKVVLHGQTHMDVIGLASLKGRSNGVVCVI